MWKVKTINNFYKNKNRYRSACKQCEQLYATSFDGKHKRKTRDKKYNLLNPFKRRTDASLTSHKKRGIKINVHRNIVEDMFRTTTHCPICGIKFTIELGNGILISSQTLDRINNETELRCDNIWIICHRCNMLKGDQSMDEYIARSRMIVDKFSR